VLEIEYRTLHMLCKFSTTELHPQPLLCFKKDMAGKIIKIFSKKNLGLQ
jgi:hypothetical protein